MLATCCHHAYNVLSNNPTVLIRGVVPLTAVRHLGFHNPGGWLPAGLKVADLSRNTLPPLLALATAVRPGQLGSWGPQVDAIPVAVHRHSGTAAKTWLEETRNALNQALTLFPCPARSGWRVEACKVPLRGQLPSTLASLGFISKSGATCGHPSADRLPGVASRSHLFVLPLWRKQPSSGCVLV